MSMLIIGALTGKVILAYSSKEFTSVTIPIVPLQMPWRIVEIHHTSTWLKMNGKGRIVLGLNIVSEEDGPHCTELTISLALLSKVAVEVRILNYVVGIRISSSIEYNSESL
uniref:Uncharacterized protein n=1 Tax=Rhizophagus irregularis (strain DAOM 181602 / DAOM 197198 / MUCL 43194) TaxID=747089 RepID=U9UTL6_RHIID